MDSRPKDTPWWNDVVGTAASPSVSIILPHGTDGTDQNLCPHLRFMRPNIVPATADNKSLLRNNVVLETRCILLFHKLDSVAVLL